MSDILAVEEYGGAGWIDRNLYGGSDGGHGSGGGVLHLDAHETLFAGLQDYALNEILVAVLTNGDDVLAGKQEDLFRSLQFFEVSDVLAVDPDAGGLFDFGFAFEFDFAHHVVAGIGCGDQGRENQE